MRDVVVPLALSVGLVASPAWSAPADPVPIQDNPHLDEGAPSARGGWFGWAQNSRGNPSHDNFFVRRGSGPRVRVNAPTTQGLGGGIVGRSVVYLQQRGDDEPLIHRLDLRTGQRVPLPRKVNDGVRGQVSVSGKWLLYSGEIEPATDFDYPSWTVMLYNRDSRRLRQVDIVDSELDSIYAGQVNGRYATYWTFGRYGGGEVYRYDIRTGRSVELPQSGPGDQYDPAVSSDGTVYYPQVRDAGTETVDLVRQPIGAPAEVVATLTGDGWPAGLFVKDRADGAKVVLFSWQSGVYRIVDG